MCFMGSSKAEPPPPPPPPPAAPPVLEQEIPVLSDADEEAAGLDGKSAGFKAYKIKKNNQYSASNDTASLGAVVQGSNKSNY
jgi:hypothetical protein